MGMTMSKTIKIRIPVAVDPQGRWYAYGWNSGKHDGPRNHDELLEVTDMDQIGPNEALFWITAELPVPEAQEVAAEVESV
jgi:hypothetical protein